MKISLTVKTKVKEAEKINKIINPNLNDQEQMMIKITLQRKVRQATNINISALII